MSTARLNNAQEILKRLSKIYKFYIPTTSPVVDTTGAAIDLNDTEITVTTFGSWATGDDIIISGSGGVELNRLGTKPGSSAPIPLVRPASLAQLNGAVISKATKVDLGYIEEAGITFGATSSKSPIGAANAGGAIAYIDADVAEPTFSFATRETSLRNLLSAFGVDEDAILGGGGSDADPYRVLITSDNIGTAANFCLRATGTLVNGRTGHFDLWDCTPEVNVSAQLGKGNPPVWGVSVKYTKMLYYTRAVALT